jgi:hypothetical protein
MKRKRKFPRALLALLGMERWFTYKEDNMKMLSLAAMVGMLSVLGTVAAEAQGQNGRYCYVTRGGGQNCGFSTRAQCESARRGLSHEPCFRNPMYGGR